jgi:hypothetical protein
MTIDVNVDVETGPVVPIPVPVTTVDVSVLPGPCVFYGFSFREASGDVPKDNEGTVTSPGAGATIVTLTGLAAGEYTVTWIVQLAGTLAAADANNFQLIDTSGGVTNSINLAVAGEYPQVNSEVIITPGGSISIIAIAAGTVGAIYSAQIAIQPSIVDDAVAELRDGNQVIACCSLGVGGSETENFGPPGVKVMNSVTLHMIQGSITGAVYLDIW